MGNGYDHHALHHHHHHRKTIFLPMLCRLSIRDIITLNRRRKTPTSADADDEPSSPKVSCMGQVKRNNRVIGFPSAAAAATHHHRYSRLKKLFSTKNLLPPTTSSAAAGASAGGGGRSRSKSFRISGELCEKNMRRLNTKGDDSTVKEVNIGEIDPPLPVVKRVAQPGVSREEVNLWRRRFNGAAALEGLQIEQIRNLPNSSQPPTV